MSMSKTLVRHLKLSCRPKSLSKIRQVGHMRLARRVRQLRDILDE